MTIAKTLVKALVSVAIFAAPVIAPSPVEVPDQESGEEREQRIKEDKALVEDLFKTSDKDNNDALSLDEFVDYQYELGIMLAKKKAPSDADWSTLGFAEELIKRQIREGLEPEWEKLRTDENDEIPKEYFFKSILGEDYKDKEESTNAERANLTRDEEGSEPNDNWEPASNEPRQSDTVTQ